MPDNKLLAIREPQQITFTQEEIGTIKNTVAKDASDTELKLFLGQCKRTGLDPFSRQIYFFKIGGKASIQASIDGFRLIAERSNKYAGQTLPQYLDEKGEWHEVWTQAGYPVAAKVGVVRADFKEPLFAIAKWKSYCPMYNGEVGAMWKKMPEVMIAKVAEALALRKAFPNDLSGIYASEEMAQADTPIEEPKHMQSYEVKRALPAADDEAGGAVIQTEEQFVNDEVTEMQKQGIKEMLAQLKKPNSRKVVKEITGFDMEPANFDAIYKALRKEVEKTDPLEVITT